MTQQNSQNNTLLEYTPTLKKEKVSVNEEGGEDVKGGDGGGANFRELGEDFLMAEFSGRYVPYKEQFDQMKAALQIPADFDFSSVQYLSGFVITRYTGEICDNLILNGRIRIFDLVTKFFLHRQSQNPTVPYQNPRFIIRWAEETGELAK